MSVTSLALVPVPNSSLSRKVVTSSVENDAFKKAKDFNETLTNFAISHFNCSKKVAELVAKKEAFGPKHISIVSPETKDQLHRIFETLKTPFTDNIWDEFIKLTKESCFNNMFDESCPNDFYDSCTSEVLAKVLWNSFTTRSEFKKNTFASIYRLLNYPNDNSTKQAKPQHF